MNGRKHNLSSALHQVQAKGCEIKEMAELKNKRIVIPRSLHIGIKIWGAIDYLCGQHGYEYIFI